MDELPFVWMLDYNGIRSIAIGTHHATLADYEKDISDKLTGVEEVLLEANLEDTISPDFLDYKDEWNKALGKFTSEEQQKLAPLLDAMTGGRLKQLYAFLNSTPTTKMGTALCGVDRTVYNVAQEKKLKTNGLETQQEQLAFAKLAYAPLLRLIENLTPEQIPNALCMLPLIRMLNDMMNKAYENGDSAPCISMAQRMPLELFQKNLERNRNMAERALPYIKSRPVAIAVGAAHFLCEPSMLHYFEKEGIRVERV